MILARRAILLAVEKRLARLDDASALVTKIQAARATKPAAFPGCPNTVDASRYTDAVLERFLELYDAHKRPAESWEVDAHRAEPPELPDEHAQRLIEEVGLNMQPYQNEPRPWWRTIICQHRQHFEHCVLAFADAGDHIAHPVVFALCMCARTLSLCIL